MPLPIVAAAAGIKGALAIKRAIAAKRAGKKPGKGPAAGVRRRPKRIVFSENQWMFVQSLMRMVGGRAPGFPAGKRRRRRRGGFR